MRRAPLGAPPVPVVLKGQRDEAEADTDKDDQEDPADVLNADTVTLVLDLGAHRLVEVPPLGFEVFQEALV